MSQSHGSQADRSTLYKVQFSALDTAAERGTSDETETTHQCAHGQWRMLEAADCDTLKPDLSSLMTQQLVGF